MSYFRKVNKTKFFATSVVVLGTFSMMKLYQDARYMRKDFKLLSKTQLNERDLEKVKQKYKLSSYDIEHLKKKKRQRNANNVENVIDKDPNFEHKRAD